MKQDRKKSQNNQTKEKEFEDRIIHIARCARIVAGGRRFSFRVTVASGNRKNKIGLGTGKGKSVSSAMEKAKRQASKNMVCLNLTKNNTIPHEIKVKFKRAVILFKPRKEKLIAGGVVRTMAQLAGIKNITAKIMGTNNKLNNARAFMKAMESIKS